MPYATPQDESAEKRDKTGRVRDQLRSKLDRELETEARKGEHDADGSPMFTDV